MGNTQYLSFSTSTRDCKEREQGRSLVMVAAGYPDGEMNRKTEKAQRHIHQLCHDVIAKYPNQTSAEREVERNSACVLLRHARVREQEGGRCGHDCLVCDEYEVPTTFVCSDDRTIRGRLDVLEGDTTRWCGRRVVLYGPTQVGGGGFLVSGNVAAHMEDSAAIRCGCGSKMYPAQKSDTIASRKGYSQRTPQHRR